MKWKAIILAMVLAAIASQSTAQLLGSRDFGPVRLASQPTRIVDLPTAGMLPRGAFRVETDVYSDGAVLLTMSVGFARYFNFGISYGGQRIIGSGDPVMNPLPAVHVRARLFEEGLLMPAIAIGFDSQGYGEYLDDKGRFGEERYLVKSRGIYGAASKNWDFLGPLSLHGGLSYSLEDDIDDDMTVFLGVIKSFGGFIDVRLEYDFAYNDNEGGWEVTEDRGFLNGSLVWHVNEYFSLALEVRDIATKERALIIEQQDAGGDQQVTILSDLRKWNRGLSIVFHDFL